MRLTAEKRKQELKALRRLIEQSPDPVERRIAWAMEQAVRYATESTVSWPSLVREARDSAALLRQELQS